MVSKHTSPVERFDTDTPGCAPSEDSSDEDIDEVNFCYEDTDMGVEDEPSFLAGSAPVADDSQDYDVGNIVLDVKGLCVQFKRPTASGGLRQLSLEALEPEQICCIAKLFVRK
ncbi:uncharacterized protein LOC122047232 [Zingiber officinale]|uniref:uncharacterized protein LOC122047232 n=1 Tax=Zingiber officinale TaxID=94328 RepID=UPI001C4D80F4|nr:uncharacterized protein LOC122047232 [Zingiber officinale]